MFGRRGDADPGARGRSRRGRRDVYAWWEYAIMALVAVLILGGIVLLVRVILSSTSEESNSSTATPAATLGPSCSEAEWRDPASGECQPRTECTGETTYDETTNTCVQAAPNMVGVDPNEGPAEGGTKLTLTGTAFQDGATVTINGVPGLETSVVDPSTIETTTPPGNVYYGVDITVTNPDGQSDTLDNVFTYNAPPVEFITEIVPPVGSTQGGEAVVIKGQDFVDGTLVSFFGRPATDIQVLNPQTMRVTIPEAPAGKVNVNVRIPGLETFTLKKGFTYRNQAPRQVLLVRPKEGGTAGGTTINITGTGFAGGADVTIGGKPAKKLKTIGSTRIQVEAPPGALGTVPVAVRNPGMPAAILENAFEYVPAPTVTGVKPARIPLKGGTKVTISGTGFENGATVTFDGAKATNVVVVSPTEIRAEAPAGKPGGAIVVVRNPGQPPGELKKAVTYVKAASTPEPTPSPTVTKPTVTACPALSLRAQSTPLGSDLILTDADLFPASVRSPKLTAAAFTGPPNSGTITWKAQPPRIVWSAPVAGSPSGTITFSYQAASCSGTGSGTIPVSAR